MVHAEAHDGARAHSSAVPTEDQRRALADLLLRLSQAMGTAVHTASGASGLTPMQARLLDGLDEDTPLPMGEVSRSLSCDLSNTTGLVDRLEQRGLLRRVAAAHDRRVRAVVPTDEGRAVRHRLDAALRVHNPLFADLSAERCADAVRVLSGLLDVEPPPPGQRTSGGGSGSTHQPNG